MIKFINILNGVISEQKRYRMSHELYSKLNDLADKLWKDRNKDYKKKTEVDRFLFKTAAGVDGLVKVFVNPRLKFIGFMDTKPKGSRDPADIELQVSPKNYMSKKNLYLTLYHEMMHAIDPTQTHEYSAKYHTTYNEKRDEMYWGHPIEFFAITNEFLEGLINEFKRRAKRVRNESNKKFLYKSLDNILNYFAKGEKLSKLSLDILYRINDEYVKESDISRILDDLATDYPELADFMIDKDDIPYYLTYIELIKKFNPKIWPRFLTMLYKSKKEIEEMI